MLPPVSTSWTEFRGQGFWCRDGMVEVWLALLVDELDQRAGEAGGDLPAWLGRLRAQWLEQVSVIYRGLVSSSLDDLVSDEARRQELVDLMRVLRDRIAGGAHTAAPGSVARAVGGAVFERERFDDQILRVADSFLWLLETGDGAEAEPPGQRLLTGEATAIGSPAAGEVGG